MTDAITLTNAERMELTRRASSRTDRAEDARRASRLVRSVHRPVMGLVSKIYDMTLKYWICGDRVSGPRFMPWVMLAVLLLACLLSMLLTGGVDRMTTISAWSKPLVWWMATASAVTVAAAVCVWWIAPPSSEGTALARLRRDHIGRWFLQGLASALGLGAFAAWVCAGLLETGAQYMDGDEEAFLGTVVSSDSDGPRAVCQERVKIRPARDGSVVSICLKTLLRPTLATRPVARGATVTVRVRNTPLGMVVLSVTPSG
jgi:hypothetical protein